MGRCQSGRLGPPAKRLLGHKPSRRFESCPPRTPRPESNIQVYRDRHHWRSLCFWGLPQFLRWNCVSDPIYRADNQTVCAVLAESITTRSTICRNNSRLSSRLNLLYTIPTCEIICSAASRFSICVCYRSCTESSLQLFAFIRSQMSHFLRDIARVDSLNRWNVLRIDLYLPQYHGYLLVNVIA